MDKNRYYADNFSTLFAELMPGVTISQLIEKITEKISVVTASDPWI